jgi:hypothetical protein
MSDETQRHGGFRYKRPALGASLRDVPLSATSIGPVAKLAAKGLLLNDQPALGAPRPPEPSAPLLAQGTQIRQ